MPTVKIYVTAGHIRRGRKRDPDFCPVALGFKAAGLKNASVAGTTEFVYNNTRYSVKTPMKAKSFYNRFDLVGRQVVKSFSFLVKFGEINRIY